MKKNNLLLWIFVLLFAVLMSIPWLVPHLGILALFGFVPLLCADDIADKLKVRHFWVYHYSAFVLWNAFTTFWVCNATVGGAIFAILANAFQMSLIFGLFRISKKRLKGVIPYIFLAVMWIAWERFYYSAQISWPWLVLGNAFARTTSLAQWYEYTGTLGGSLWIWACNLSLYGVLAALSDGLPRRWTAVARIAVPVALAAVFIAPVAVSRHIYRNYEEQSEGTIHTVIGQPNFDPYHKFESLSQAEQNTILLDIYRDAVPENDTSKVLFLAPETFTSDIVLNTLGSSATCRSFQDFLKKRPNANILFGASTYDIYEQRSAPSILARPYGDGWSMSHNSALITDASGRYEVFHKNKLVVGTELTPFPRIFVPLDNKLGGVMGRCVGQEGISLLHFAGEIPIGCAVCYESVYGEYCTGYVREGAKVMTVITNDAWWGDTPGYRQHLSYSSLRAIELRRDIARCANTGISAFINQRGDIVEATPWWEKAVLEGDVNLNSKVTAFVRYGDITGRVCTLAFLLLLALLAIRLFIPRRG